MTAPTPDLKAIRARYEAATSGPWQMRDVGYVFAADTSDRAAESGYDGTPIVDTFMWPEHGRANQVFIAHAREDIPALLDTLAAVTAERDQERGQHEATKSTLDKAWDDLRQARQMLADAEKKIASMELDESLREEDERFADPL